MGSPDTPTIPAFDPGAWGDLGNVARASEKIKRAYAIKIGNRNLRYTGGSSSRVRKATVMAKASNGVGAFRTRRNRLVLGPAGELVDRGQLPLEIFVTPTSGTIQVALHVAIVASEKARFLLQRQLAHPPTHATGSTQRQGLTCAETN